MIVALNVRGHRTLSSLSHAPIHSFRSKENPLLAFDPITRQRRQNPLPQKPPRNHEVRLQWTPLGPSGSNTARPELDFSRRGVGGGNSNVNRDVSADARSGKASPRKMFDSIRDDCLRSRSSASGEFRAPGAGDHAGEGQASGGWHRRVGGEASRRCSEMPRWRFRCIGRLS